MAIKANTRLYFKIKNNVIYCPVRFNPRQISAYAYEKDLHKNVHSSFIRTENMRKFKCPSMAE